MTTTESMARPHSHGATPEGPVHATRADRFTSFNVSDFSAPTGREEDWRFTPMRRIAPVLDQGAYGQGSIAETYSHPQEVTIESGSALVDGSVLAPSDRAAAIAWETRESTTVVTIPAKAELEAPVIIDMDALTGVHSHHLVIRIGELALATVIVNHRGGADATLNQTVEIEAGDSSHATIVAVQEWEDSTIHAASHRVAIGRDAKVRHIVVTLGGDLVRINAETDFRGPGGDLEMLGLYFVDAGQHLEHRVFVDHSQPHCISRVTYKGALQGNDAHSVWIGDCLIREAADGTDTYELNRNLVLTEGAKADSVPNLEIENGEIVGAGHASATGRFDDDQLFYLMSRGISEQDARRLVVRGFFAELIDQIGVPAVQEHLMAAIETELEKSAN
ncbi:MAG: Fe-S cluster assembly protein SufD [Actinomycetaceae bacterium]|nr:Fe-S cluster assembly protein SufD [Actinomycetaceae bacterium]